MKSLKNLLLLSIFTTIIAHADVNVVVNNASTPVATVNASGVAPTISPTQNPNSPTLAQLNKPTDSQLSQANQQLLTQNTELQREIDSLKTQVNVLINERSGQLFIYGAFTAVVSFVAGVLLSFLILGRKRGW